MACKLTYQGVQYNSKKDLADFLLREQGVKRMDGEASFVLGTNPVADGSVMDKLLKDSAPDPVIHSAATKFIHKFSRQPQDNFVDRATYKSDRKWGKAEDGTYAIDPNTKLFTEYGHVNHAQYKEAEEQKMKTNVLRGTAVDAKLAWVIEGKPEDKARYDQAVSEGGFRTEQFDYLNSEREIGPVKYKAINYLLSKLGIKVNSRDADSLKTQVVIKSDILGLSGVIDLLAQDVDGNLSIVEFKAGATMDKIHGHDLLFFGSTLNTDMNDTPKTMADLQASLYALMIKITNPEARFKAIVVPKVYSEDTLFTANRGEYVNMQATLEVLKKNIQKNNPAAYAQLEQLPHFNQLFDYRAYASETVPEEFSQYADNTQELKLRIMREITSLLQYKGNVEHEQSKDDYARAKLAKAKELTIELVKMQDKVLGIDTVGRLEDLHDLARAFGHKADISHPYVQVFNSLFEEAQAEFFSEYNEVAKVHRSKLKKVFDYYMDTTGKWSKIGGKIFPPMKDMINNPNYAELYDFAFAYKADGSLKLNTTQAEWDAAQVRMQQKIPGFVISDIHKDYVNFLNKTFGSIFIDSLARDGKALANRKATTHHFNSGDKIDVNNLELRNGLVTTPRGVFNIRHEIRSPFEYEDGFFWKVPKTLSETGRDAPNVWAKWKKRLEYIYSRNLTLFEEADFEENFNTHEAIPFKYLGNDSINRQHDHSLNLEFIFELGMRHHMFKKHMDPVWGAAKGIEYVARQPLHAGALNPEMKNLADFMAKNIKQNLQNRSQVKLTIASRGDSKSFSFVKLLKLIKKVTSWSTMWFKFIPGAGNSLYTIMAGFSEGNTGRIGKSFVKDQKNIDFTETDFIAATKDLAEMQKDAMLGKLKNNKLLLLLKEFNYSPNAPLHKTRDKSMLTKKLTALTTERIPYLPYAMVEEAVAAIILAAQLRRMKVESGPLKGTSIMDMYEVKEQTIQNEVIPVLTWRNGTDGNPYVRGVEKATGKVITKLDPKEIQRLKQVYTKLLGGYREEEKTAMEYYVFGQLFMQYKKYLPNIINTMLQDRGGYASLGTFQEVEPGVLSWESAEMEGRFRVVSKYLIQLAMSSPAKHLAPAQVQRWFEKHDQLAPYKWDQLSDRDKLDVIDAYRVFTVWSIMFLGYLKLFGAGGSDRDRLFGYMYQRIMDDMSQRWNLLEISKNLMFNLKSSALVKGYQTMTAVSTFGFNTMLYYAGQEEAATLKTDRTRIKGTTQLYRALPIGSAMYDWMMRFESTELAKDPFRSAK